MARLRIVFLLGVCLAIAAFVQSASVADIERLSSRSDADGSLDSLDEMSEVSEESSEDSAVRMEDGGSVDTARGVGSPPETRRGGSTFPPVNPTPDVLETTATASGTTSCFVGQSCTTVDLLDNDGTQRSVSALYRAALSTFNPTLLEETVQTLLREANSDIVRVCGNQFTSIGETVLRVTQSSGPGIVEFGFADNSSPRRLNNAQVSFTVPGLASYGAVQLRFSYNPSGALSSVMNFIQPPTQTTFFPFPLEQQICTEDVTICASSPPTQPPEVQAPSPLPVINPTDLFDVVLPASINARCL